MVRPPPLTVVPTMTALMAGRPSLKALYTSRYHLVALVYHLCLAPSTSGIPLAAPSGIATNLHPCETNNSLAFLYDFSSSILPPSKKVGHKSVVPPGGGVGVHRGGVYKG